MAVTAIIKSFTSRYPRVGPIAWLLSIQYYLVQIVVGKNWATSYSWFSNTISDLGNTVCGTYRANLVCSPLHNLMNASFLILGITMISGSALIYQQFKKSRSSLIGFGCMAISGIGTIMVGLYPENSISQLHILGAALSFVIGNLALIILGSRLSMPKVLGIYTVTSGIIALSALLLFLTHNYLGLGIGGMERLVAYPQTIWLMIFSMYILSDRNHRRRAV